MPDFREGDFLVKDSRYHVGDNVRIVDTLLDIDMGNKLRSSRSGAHTTIRSVTWCDLCGRYEYRVRGDTFIWCDDNLEFDDQQELPEFNASEIDLESLFG